MASLTFTSEAGPWPSRHPDEEHADLVLWRRREGEPHDLVLAHASGLTVTVAGSDARVGGDCEWLAVGFRRLFPLALCPILACHDRVLLHAGGVVGPAGALVVLGPTGAGKSTLVLAAHHLGWECLADDLVVLRRPEGASATTGPALEVAGIPRLLAAPGDVVSSGDATAILPDDDRRRSLVTDIGFASGWFSVAGVMFVGHSSRVEGELHRVPAEEVLPAALGGFHSSGDIALLRRALPYLGALTRLPAWRLLHGSEPRHRLASAATHLRDASQEIGGTPGATPSVSDP
jgi:hypothetical protein